MMRILLFVFLFATARVLAFQPSSFKTTGSTRLTTSLNANGQLEYVDVVEGKGVSAGKGDRISVHYVGKFKDSLGKETVFEDSRQSKATRGTFGTVGDPISFGLGGGQVIKGWEEGIMGNMPLGNIPPMKVGGTRTLDIPAALAYGEEGRGEIPPNQDLIFDVELVRIDVKQNPLLTGFNYLVPGVFGFLILNSLYLYLTGQA